MHCSPDDEWRIVQTKLIIVQPWPVPNPLVLKPSRPNPNLVQPSSKGTWADSLIKNGKTITDKSEENRLSLKFIFHGVSKHFGGFLLLYPETRILIIKNRTFLIWRHIFPEYDAHWAKIAVHNLISMYMCPVLPQKWYSASGSTPKLNKPGTTGCFFSFLFRNGPVVSSF